MSNVNISNRYKAILREKILEDAKFIKVTAAGKKAIVPITSKYIDGDNISISYKLTSNLGLGKFSSMNLTLLSDSDEDNTITESVEVTATSEIDLSNPGTLILMNWVVSLSTSSNNGGN